MELIYSGPMRNEHLDILVLYAVSELNKLGQAPSTKEIKIFIDGMDEDERTRAIALGKDHFWTS
jgi:hypothetical protein